MIYQLQISLRNITPKIWRRVIVSSDIMLPELHEVIQATMGWFNGYLHEFRARRNAFAKHGEELYNEDLNTIDYTDIKLSYLLKKEMDKMTYIYDFGDLWEHDIVLEKVNPEHNVSHIPFCLTGKNSCPPEDCGGVKGYSNLKQVLDDPLHKKHEDYKDWLGVEVFDPKSFKRDEINELLISDDFRCLELA